MTVAEGAAHFIRHVALLCALSTGARCAAVPAPRCGVERELSISSVEVEAALRSIKAYSGDRLPTLEGFAARTETPLSLFKRGYFEYSLQVVPVGDTQTRLHVCAKITAWLDAPDSTPGYRQLPSNGRLEADLFDRLKDAIRTLPLASLPPSFASTASSSVAHDSTVQGSSTSGTALAATTDTVGAPAVPVTNSPGGPPHSSMAPANTPLSEEGAIHALTMRARALEEALGNQTHPRNLVAVRRSRSPILDRPEGSRVLLYADAEDEFQRESESGMWVQVLIGGTSRGWIRRSLLEAPSSAPALLQPPNESSNERIEGVTEQISIFPGKWQPLDGKQVKVISFASSTATSAPTGNKKTLSTAVFRKAYHQIAAGNPKLAGVVIVFDSADGLMAAATKESLEQWELGHLSNSAFWKQCYLDPKDAFKATD